jgi:hypothetical protein
MTFSDFLLGAAGGNDESRLSVQLITFDGFTFFCLMFDSGGVLYLPCFQNFRSREGAEVPFFNIHGLVHFIITTQHPDHP